MSWRSGGRPLSRAPIRAPQSVSRVAEELLVRRLGSAQVGRSAPPCIFPCWNTPISVPRWRDMEGLDLPLEVEEHRLVALRASLTGGSTAFERAFTRHRPPAGRASARRPGS